MNPTSDTSQRCSGRSEDCAGLLGVSKMFDRRRCLQDHYRPCWSYDFRHVNQSDVRVMHRIERGAWAYRTEKRIRASRSRHRGVAPHTSHSLSVRRSGSHCSPPGKNNFPLGSWTTWMSYSARIYPDSPRMHETWGPLHAMWNIAKASCTA